VSDVAVKATINFFSIERRISFGSQSMCFLICFSVREAGGLGTCRVSSLAPSVLLSSASDSRCLKPIGVNPGVGSRDPLPRFLYGGGSWGLHYVL